MNEKISSVRDSALARLSDEQFDVVVVGAGIGGAFTAWDAALRGLKVALVEKSDFCSGASAHSLKILHGGIRYLQHLDFERLRESCGERAAFLRIAPHLTRPLPVAIPTYGWGIKGKLPLRAAFTLLEMLTHDRNRGIPDQRQHIPRPYMLSRQEMLDKVPNLESKGLTGAGVFYDGQVLDPARLVYSIVRSAEAAGAVVVNYCAASGLLVRNGSVEGLVAVDAVSGRRFEVRAPIVADVTGPFAPKLSGVLTGREISQPLSRDMAIVVRRKLLPEMALAVQTKYKDPDAWLSRGNRHLFLCPWRDQYTLIGVNSRVYTENPYELSVTEPEILQFVEEIRSAWPALDLRREDITAVNAGLLPFGENTPDQKNLSFGKRSQLIDHAASGGPRGLFTGMAVRLTMGRLLGEQLTDAFVARLGRSAPACRTSELTVWDGDLARRRSGADNVQRLPADYRPSADELRRLVLDEMVVTLNDLVLRRLDVGTGECPDHATLEGLAGVVGRTLGWSAERVAREVELVEQSFPFATPVSQTYLGLAA